MNYKKHKIEILLISEISAALSVGPEHCFKNSVTWSSAVPRTTNLVYCPKIRTLYYAAQSFSNLEINTLACISQAYRLHFAEMPDDETDIMAIEQLAKYDRLAVDDDRAIATANFIIDKFR